ncbi:phosphatidylinositol N-acetylglucosaminyltransferase subunit gpi1 [Tulasnella sp. JGI-2019a]|nr:phosphatidylinositol N-acetylglucosaminyltransferase subunit gpi1 [Tulasnella sp. JGI-2019a]
MSTSIFWPYDACNKSGFVYGWSDGQDVVVADVLPGDQRGVEKTLGFLDLQNMAAQELSILAGGRAPEVLGISTQSDSGSPVPALILDSYELSNRQPFRFILYNPPQIVMLRFFSLEPLHLDVMASRTLDPPGNNDKIILSERIDALHEMDFTKSTLEVVSLQTTINRLNVVHEFSRLVNAKSPNVNDKTTCLPWSTPKLITDMMTGIQKIGRVVTAACSMQIPFSGRSSSAATATMLKDVSAAVQQIDTRMEQATILPTQLQLIRKRSRRNVAASTAQYISFWNCIWLILNDVIIGASFGAFLSENCDTLGVALERYTKVYAIDLIRDSLLWLDDWPAGLKLNTQLSHFLCLSFVGLTDAWATCLTVTGPYFPSLINLAGICGWAGFTMLISLASDALSILTVHLYFSYMVATTVFSQQLSVLASLWRLFRGKRRNVLRNRTDSWDYDVDQLILGTILFTLLAFLLPTIVVYYVLFATARVVIITVHATLETCLAFLNHFPLFAMMLRMKDPSRLPGGVYFNMSKRSKGFIELKNQPISFGRIFFQYVGIWSKVSAHYSPQRLLRCLVTGVIISPIQRYKIRYSMIPTDSGEERFSQPVGSKEKAQ